MPILIKTPPVHNYSGNLLILAIDYYSTAPPQETFVNTF